MSKTYFIKVSETEILVTKDINNIQIIERKQPIGTEELYNCNFIISEFGRTYNYHKNDTTIKYEINYLVQKKKNRY